LAEGIGLRAIAITDHDTLDGAIEALNRSSPAGVEILAGVEISADVPSGGMHILGYRISTGESPLRTLLGRLQAGREERNGKIVRRLQDLGVDITHEEVLAAARGGQVGRPHFAAVLVDKGRVGSFDEAFTRYLGASKPAHVQRFRPAPHEAIRAIREAGGVAVLAHPYTVETSDDRVLEGRLRRLRDWGLQGIEVYYPDHDARRTARYEDLARRYDLVATGGTDFHGRAKPGVHLGVGRGDLRVPYSVVEELKACRG
jgi:predicted metal-dependent phosphoesterase TrpH